MIQPTDDTILVGATELRSKMPEITKKLKTTKVIVIKRGEPIAILENFKDHEEKEKLIDTFEDLVLGYLAKEREEASSEDDYVSEEEVAETLNITL